MHGRQRLYPSVIKWAEKKISFPDYVGGGRSRCHHRLESTPVLVPDAEDPPVGQRGQPGHDHRLHRRLLRRASSCGQVTKI